MLGKIFSLPLDKEKGLSKDVALAVNYIRQEATRRGMKSELYSMDTEIVGNRSDIREVLNKTDELMRKSGKSIYTSITLYDDSARISTFPLDKKESEYNEVINYAIEEAEKVGMKYRKTEFGVEIEGDDNNFWRIVRETHEKSRNYKGRAYTVITIDDREGKTNAITEKVESIERILEKSE
ncbi:MAG: thiamine-binding protein [Candidatus Aenigmarchaeota archaeon]|nr:thiamine-binding protein [Candidatus Aenigmarchaeota archaeon]